MKGWKFTVIGEKKDTRFAAAKGGGEMRGEKRWKMLGSELRGFFIIIIYMSSKWEITAIILNSLLATFQSCW